MLQTMQAYTESHQILPKSVDLESIVRDDYNLENLLEAAQQYGLAGNIHIGAQRLCLVRLFIKFEEGFQYNPIVCWTDGLDNIEIRSREIRPRFPYYSHDMLTKSSWAKWVQF